MHTYAVYSIDGTSPGRPRHVTQDPYCSVELWQQTLSLNMPSRTGRVILELTLIPPRPADSNQNMQDHSSFTTMAAQYSSQLSMIRHLTPPCCSNCCTCVDKGPYTAVLAPSVTQPSAVAVVSKETQQGQRLDTLALTCQVMCVIAAVPSWH
eukprot:GHUV01039385.1.p1 GENE.GHUV01039385.1~~GHUV01039385.1.p1  ORF type:complete len:152 (-),score=28.42 GHUV01039385.1:147-602(-)